MDIRDEAGTAGRRSTGRTGALLSGALKESRVAVGVVGRNYRVVFANAALRAVNEPLNTSRILRQDGEPPANPDRKLSSLVERALHQRKGVGVVELEERTDEDRPPRRWDVELRAIADADGNPFAAMIVSEVTPSQAVEPLLPNLDQLEFEETPAGESGEAEVGAAVVAEDDLVPASLLDALHTYVAVLHLDGRVERVNAAAIERADMSAGEADDAPFWETFWWTHDASEAARIRDAVERAAAGEVVRFEAKARIGSDPQSDLLEVDVRFAPLQDEAGTVTRVVSSAFDITKHKSATEDARREVAEVRSDNDDKLKAIAVLGHEFRNPLAAAGMAMQLLNIDPKLRPFREADPDVDESFAALERSMASMRQLMDDLGDFNHLVRGKLVMNRERLDLRVLVGDAANACSKLMAERDHELDVSLPDEPAWVLGDQVRLAQVTTNLLTNAARYTDLGGRITLDLSTVNERHAIRVSDTGRGLDPETFDRIFEPFEQADTSAGGLGLGLSLCKEIVAAHGGDISVASDGLGEGSTFTVHLPVAS